MQKTEIKTMSVATNILLLFLSLSTICHASNPGIKLQITENALNTGVQYIFNKLTEGISNATVPDVVGNASLGDYDIKYKLSQIKITRLNYNSLVSTYVPQTGMKIILLGGNAEIICTWNLKSYFLNDSGTAVITISEGSISMLLGVYQSNLSKLNGVPSISMLACESLFQVDIKMQSGISYVYDALKEPIVAMVRNSVYQQLCPALSKHVKQLDFLLKNLQLNFSLIRMIHADWSLINEIEINDKYADFSFKGQFKLHGETNVTFSPDPMVFPTQENPRSYAGISEASLNSLLSAYFTSGSLNLMLSNLLESTTLTTSELAAIIPEISQLYKSPASWKINLNITNSPIVHLGANNITMELGGHLQIFVITTQTKAQFLYGSKILTTLTGDISLTDSNEFLGLNMSVSFSLHRFQLDKSGPSSEAPKGVSLEQALQQIFSQWVLPPINENLNKGIYIPTQFLRNSTITSKEKFVLLEVDMNWDMFHF